MSRTVSTDPRRQLWIALLVMFLLAQGVAFLARSMQRSRDLERIEALESQIESLKQSIDQKVQRIEEKVRTREAKPTGH